MINIISKKSFTDVLYEWLDYKKQDVKESTYFRYLYQIETNILPNIDDISFNKLSIKHIENLFNNDEINKFSICLIDNLLKEISSMLGNILVSI